MSETCERSTGSPEGVGISGLKLLWGRTTCSIEEAAHILGIGRSTAYAAAHDGSLPTLRISGRILVPVAKLVAMIGLEGEEREDR